MILPGKRLGFARSRDLIVCVLLLAMAGTGLALADTPGEDEKIAVYLDQARLVKMPERVSTIVIGNPLIADASIQTNGLMVITGKGYGVTNIVALDRNGSALLEKQIVVRGPYDGTVVVYRGVQRNTYSCTPFCDPRVTVGDAPNFFGPNLSQTTTWNAQVNGAAQLGRR